MLHAERDDVVLKRTPVDADNFLARAGRAREQRSTRPPVNAHAVIVVRTDGGEKVSIARECDGHHRLFEKALQHRLGLLHVVAAEDHDARIAPNLASRKNRSDRMAGDAYHL